MANDERADRIERSIESSRDALLDYVLKRQEYHHISLPCLFCYGLLSSFLFPNQATAATTTTTITIPTSYSLITIFSTKNVTLFKTNL